MPRALDRTNGVANEIRAQRRPQGKALSDKVPELRLKTRIGCQSRRSVIGFLQE